MKFKLTKAEFDKEPPHVQALCVQEGDSYTFDTGTVEDVGGLKSAKDKERQNAAAAKKELADLKATLAEVQAELNTYSELAKGSIPKANLETLESSYKTKLANQEKALKADIDRLNAALHNEMIGSKAAEIAGRLSTVPALMKGQIATRLAVEFDSEGKALVRVKDGEGKISALTLQDLEKEILANPDFKPILKASNGGGSGSQHANPGAGSPGSIAEAMKQGSAGKVEFFKGLRAKIESEGA